MSLLRNNLSLSDKLTRLISSYLPITDASLINQQYELLKLYDELRSLDSEYRHDTYDIRFIRLTEMTTKLNIDLSWYKSFLDARRDCGITLIHHMENNLSLAIYWKSYGIDYLDELKRVFAHSGRPDMTTAMVRCLMTLHRDNQLVNDWCDNDLDDTNDLLKRVVEAYNKSHHAKLDYDTLKYILPLDEKIRFMMLNDIIYYGNKLLEFVYNVKEIRDFNIKPLIWHTLILICRVEPNLSTTKLVQLLNETSTDMRQYQHVISQMQSIYRSR